MKGETKRAVQTLLIEGLSNKEICERLHLSKSAVNAHIRKLYAKHGLYGLADARRLIVLLVTEALAGRANEEARLTNGAADSIVSASTARCSSNGRGENHHADDAAQL